MVVAHPDDEIIFGGAHLMCEKQWKVICVTNGYNARRSQEFINAMELVGAEFEIWNYEDSYSYNLNLSSLRQDLQKVIAENQFKKVVTHNLQGEYGHPQHQALARIMRQIVKSDLYVFSSCKRLLPETVRSIKHYLLYEVYLSQRRTISELPLNRYINRECFVRVK